MGNNSFSIPDSEVESVFPQVRLPVGDLLAAFTAWVTVGSGMRNTTQIQQRPEMFSSRGSWQLLDAQYQAALANLPLFLQPDATEHEKHKT